MMCEAGIDSRWGCPQDAVLPTEAKLLWTSEGALSVMEVLTHGKYRARQGRNKNEGTKCVKGGGKGQSERRGVMDRRRLAGGARDKVPDKGRMMVAGDIERGK